ncbi:MAG TPA: 1-acylglycerol-3-phosphate O-acyltransferase [Pseudothermotoga sp.]|nr:1-acylglycerol-3-phosphate O-acyltransferase [Pseudothermotoga sp.]HOK83180.1 1-acylglycerol-3-phosphate O-acyltransferase [Pseudothermotoga sp.]HPP69648.1 1-acylglycerol-3-phosphate O-acyltransferase [Pseudothermotoga sp.]
MKRILVTIYFLVAAVVYIIVYGSLVLFIGLIIRLFAGKSKARKFIDGQIKIFGKNAFRWMFSPTTVLGEENICNNCLVVANHQSLMDIPLILGYVGPMPMVAKKELSKVPGVNWFLKYMGGFFLDRNNPAEGAQIIKKIMKTLSSGNSLLIFPEGTRSVDGTVGRFKTAIFKVAKKLNVKILPISIWGTIFLVPKRSLFLNPGPVSMMIHPPVDPSDFSGEEELAQKVEEIVRLGVERLKAIGGDLK